MIDKLPKICSYVCYSHNYTSSGQKWNHANGACGFAWRHACLMCLSLRVFFAWIFSGFDMKLTLVREACVELLIWSFILSVHQDNWAVHGNIRARLSLSRFLHLEFFCDKIKLAALVTIFMMISAGIYIMRECSRSLIPKWLHGPDNKLSFTI